MAEVNYLNQIKFSGPGYLDSKIQPVNTYDDLLKIPRGQRFVGLEVVVLSDVNNNGQQTKYWLVGGTSNTNWVVKNPTISSDDDNIIVAKNDGLFASMYYEGDDTDEVTSSSNVTPKKIKIWRGSRSSYDSLGIYDFWTRYSVREEDGSYTEYYGTNRITSGSDMATGTLLPVNDILPSLPEEPKMGDRFLIGTDADKYNVYEVIMIDVNGVHWRKTPLRNLSVKVISKNLMEYQYVNGKLITYDIVDCGVY